MVVINAFYVPFSLEQDLIFKEFIEMTFPSIFMTKPLFTKFMSRKGVKEDKAAQYFR